MTSSPDRESAGLPAAASGISTRRQLAGAAVAVFGLAAVTLALAGHRDDVLLSTPVLLVLAVVVAVSLIGGIRPALPAAIIGFLLLNIAFTEPYGTFEVHRFDQGLALAVYMATAAAVSVAVGIAARRHSQAVRATAEAAELSSLAGTRIGEQEGLADVLRRIRTVFGVSYAAVVELDGQHWRVVEASGDLVEDGSLRIDVSERRALQVAGQAMRPEDRRMLTAFARAAVASLDGEVLARQAAEAARLSSIDQLRTALLAGVGHDLRTPLAGIKAAVTSLRADDVQWTDADRAELLDAVQRSADRLEALVANLLGASRLDAGALSVNVGPVDVEEIVGQGMQGLSDPRRVIVDIPEHLPLVLADLGLAERVLANLIDNALRHSDKGSSILVTAAARHDQVWISVVDTGPGVPAGQRASLFAPYQRLGDRTPGGLGLGLSVADGFTRAMAGTLEAAETPGGGLTMHIRLPTVPA